MSRWVLVAIALSIVGSLVFTFSFEVERLGRNIQSTTLMLDWYIALGWSLILGLLFLLFPVSTAERRILLLLWTFRVVICLIASLWYEAHYDFLDAFTYFRLSKDAWDDWAIGFGNGTENVISLCWLHQRVFPECYHAMKVSFSAIGLLGVWFFYLGAKRAFPQIFSSGYLWLIGLIPGVVFWSSIIGKDPLMFFGVGLYSYGVCRWAADRDSRAWWYICAGIAVSSLIRVWVAPVLCLPLIYLSLRDVVDIRQRILYGILSVGFMAGAVTMMADIFGVNSLNDAVYQANEVSKSWATGGSAQNIEEVESVASLGAALPWWMFSFLFRPFPGEVDNAFGLLSGVEGLALLMAFVWALFRLRARDWRLPLVRWAVLLVLGYVALFSIAGYQNLGTAVRWRLPTTPFLAAFVAYALLIRRQRIDRSDTREMATSVSVRSTPQSMRR